MPQRLILVVEDDPTLQKVAKLALTHLGFDCEVVGSGEEAVKRTRGDVSLIFMDVGLPGITGSTATVLIRQNEVTQPGRHVPIIGLTGHELKKQCLEAGMDDFLQKPALLSDLKHMIDKWLPGINGTH